MNRSLVINCGTSSVKMTLFTSSGKVHRLELKLDSSIAETLHKGVEHFADFEMDIIGHRVVHGGEKYTRPTLITSDVEKELQKLNELAPLHNPPALEGITYCRTRFPNVPQLAVFDTAFHAKIPPKAALYPLPWELAQKHHIKRYGFHGIAHAFSWDQYSSKCGTDKKVITLHLGSGSSLAAIERGISIDTSMGFTPLDGLMMATRCGELDPAIFSYLCEKEKKSPHEILALMNQDSGLLGICGEKEMQKILERKDAQAGLAVEMFVYHIVKKVGAYIAVLGDVDALIFSGGIGENAPQIREKIIAAFPQFSLEEKKNRTLKVLPGEMKEIHHISSQVEIYVVGSDENRYIANQVNRWEKEDGKDACSASYKSKRSP